jgi:hypothetical protein
MTGNQNFLPGYLLGERVYVANPVQLTALGVIATSAQPASGVHGIVALYDDVGGLPSALLAQTPSTTVKPGDNLIPVATPVSLAVGSYWIMAEYDASASICVDTSVSNPIAWVGVGGYGVVPASLSNQKAMSTVDFNYYLVATQ